MDRKLEYLQTQPLTSLIGDSGATPIFTVQLLGFDSREQTLFASVFKLSLGRATRYVQFDPQVHSHADFFLIDSSNEAAVAQFASIDVQASGGALLVGEPAFENPGFPVITRPIRWAEVVLRLDELPRPAYSAQLTALLEHGIVEIVDKPQELKAPETPKATVETASVPDQAAARSPATPALAAAENELEISSIQDWYDRNKVVTFQTDPAVLVIDGDLAVRRYMAAKFIDLNYRVDFAESGEQGIEFIRSNRYNAVFLETVLPGIDGYDICRAIKTTREDRRRIAVIFVSQRGSTLDRVKGAMAGCDAYLTKPIEQEKLVATLDKFLPNWRLQLPLV